MGKRSQHKFRLGNDLKQAARREAQLVALWDKVELLQSLAGGEPLWNDTTLELGCQLARGALPLRLALRADESEEAYAGRVKQAQNCISKDVEAADQKAFERGLEKVRASSSGVLVWEWDLPDLSKEPVVKLPLLSRPAASGDAKTLHQAFKDYAGLLRKTFHSEHLGRITANGFNRIKQVEILIDRHGDLPLQMLGHDQVIRWRT